MTDGSIDREGENICMGEKKRRIYEALIDGATEGLTADALHNYVCNRCPDASSKKIVRASLGALQDKHVQDASILRAVYALAIRERMRRFGIGVPVNEVEDCAQPIAPSPKQQAPRARKGQAPAEAGPSS